ncbi:MAG: ribosome maturation factor RimM [Lachnospiraceae bacterium]|nr:ribosome maturation factor RimM [Lachnospiraceae bacterium]
MSDRLRVGVISSVHGIHGECKVFPTTDETERFKKLKKVYIEERGTERELELESVKFFKNMAICKFKGIDTPEDIQKFRNKDLMIDREDAIPLKKDEYFIADLIGCSVVDEDGKILGNVAEVFPTGANQVMEVKGGEKDFLMPFIKDCILRVDTDDKKIFVHVLDGLLDI